MWIANAAEEIRQEVGGGEPQSGSGAGFRGFRVFRGYSIGGTPTRPSPEMPDEPIFPSPGRSLVDARPVSGCRTRAVPTAYP